MQIREGRIEYSEKYRRDNRERINERQRERYHRKKWQYPARHAVRSAVLKGIMKKLDCEVCSATDSQFHHTNGYDEPNYLVGVWLCPRHHHDEHMKIRREKNYAR